MADYDTQGRVYKRDSAKAAEGESASAAASVAGKSFTAGQVKPKTAAEGEKDLTDAEIAGLSPISRAAYMKRKKAANPQAIAVQNKATAP